MIAPAKNKKKKVGAVLVIGGGIAGIQAALDLAETGQKVYLLENSPAIGGNMARLDKTFPTNDCSTCILSPKLVEAGRHLNIELITYADLESVKGQPGHFTVKIKKRPRHVDPDKCTGCGLCATVDVPKIEELVEHDGQLWVKRITVDEIKCVQCGDCVRACVKENPDVPAMSSIHDEQTNASDSADSEQRTGATELRRVLAMSQSERLDYWQKQLAKCMKCYGCKDICPVFVSNECKLTDWATPGFLPPDVPLYHLARAYYISQRCTNCGFCEETCPSNIPLRTLADIIRHEDSKSIFDFVPGASDEQKEKIIASFIGYKKEEVET